MGFVSFVLVLVAIVVGALFALVEVVIRLVLVVAGLVGRVVLRRPWTLEATAEGAERVRRHAVGWSPSVRARRGLMEDLAAGDSPAVV